MKCSRLFLWERSLKRWLQEYWRFTLRLCVHAPLNRYAHAHESLDYSHEYANESVCEYAHAYE